MPCPEESNSSQFAVHWGRDQEGRLGVGVANGSADVALFPELAEDLVKKLQLQASQDLASDQLVMSSIALWGPAIPIGLILAGINQEFHLFHLLDT